jgi:hypothetical protein
VLRKALGIAPLLVAAAAVFPLAATASHGKHARHLRLSLVPLQTAQFGPDGASLAIQFDSGTVSNRDTPTGAKKFGRVSGYLLDYGDPFVGGAGVTEIETQVEQFHAPAGAKKALKFWKTSDTLEAKLYHQIGIEVSAGSFKVHSVGSGHFAYVMELQVPNADPLYLVDEVATSGSFALHATVSAGTESTAEHLAPAPMTRLVHRLRQLLGRHLHGSPAKPPPLPEPGPPPGGPDLSTFVVGPSDFTGNAVAIDQGYGIDPTALSTYAIELRPAGAFDDLQQSISWYANANEATWEGTVIVDLFSQGASSVDVSAVGDNASGVIVSGTDNGSPVFFAVVSMWQGQAVDFTIAESATTIQPSSVQALAQAMANHLNAGLAGAGAQAPTTWTSQRRSRSRSSSMKRMRCHVPSWSSPSRTGTDSPAVPSSIAMQWEWPLPWSMSSGQMFSVRRSQSSCA